MTWNVAAVLGAFAAPPGYALVHAAPEDVPALVAFLRDTYPDVAVGSDAAHLDPRFYATRVHLAGTSAELPLVALLAKQNDAIVAALTLEQAAHVLHGRLGAVAPAHRAAALGLLGPRLLEAFGRAMGAELLQYYATLKTRHQQVIAERLGFVAVGIVPASDRETTEHGVRRVHEVLYAKVLGTDVQEPSPDAMTARTRALYRQIFGR